MSNAKCNLCAVRAFKKKHSKILTCIDTIDYARLLKLNTEPLVGSFDTTKDARMILVSSPKSFDQVTSTLSHFRKDRVARHMFLDNVAITDDMTNGSGISHLNIKYFIPPIVIWDKVFFQVHEHFLRPCTIQYEKLTTTSSSDNQQNDGRVATLFIDCTTGQFLLDTPKPKITLCGDILQFKVCLSVTSQSDDVVYSPGLGAPFYSRSGFAWEIIYNDDQDDEIDDDYSRERHNPDATEAAAAAAAADCSDSSDASTDDDDDDDDDDDVGYSSDEAKKFITQQDVKSSLMILTKKAIDNLADILVSRRFKKYSKHLLGYLLNHDYDDYEPQNLRDNDKHVYDALLNNQHVKRLVLIPVRLVTYPKKERTMVLYISKKLACINKQLEEYVDNPNEFVDVVASVNQKLKKIYSNKNVTWYSASLCLIEFF